MKTLTLTLLAGLTALLLSATRVEETTSDKAVIAAQLPSYPLTTCVVSGEPLDSMGGPKDVVHEGRLVRICCGGCTKAVKKDAKKLFAKIDAAVIAAQKPSYPLKTCAVSGEEFGGDMGKAIDYVVGTRYVKLCCKMCKRGVDKNPAKVLAKIDAALIEAQKKTYPLTTCLVSGEDHEGSHDVLYGTRLVRLCCDHCEEEFKKEPTAFLAKLDKAAMKASKKAGAAPKKL